MLTMTGKGSYEHPLYESRRMSVNDEDYLIHVWTPAESTAKATCVVFHGFSCHGLHVSTLPLMEALVASNYRVVAPDLRAHGLTSPKFPFRAYLDSHEALVDDSVKVVEFAKSLDESASLFVLGFSMGGALSLLAAHRLKEIVTGVVALAPLLRIAELDNPVKRKLVQTFNWVLPIFTVPEILGRPSRESLCRDPVLRDIDDPRSAPFLFLKSTYTLSLLGQALRKSFATLELPFLMLIPTEDKALDSVEASRLFAMAQSKDKEEKKYPALHDLLCELPPLVDQILGDVVGWVDARVEAT